ncbi:MAG TPA: diguanylate cyclase [Tepidiformaceae bacterium]
MRILIAEDDRVSALLLQRTLERMGHAVTVSTDGRDAWNAYQEDPFSLVISDWMMPGVDGLELCRNIRQSGADSYTYVILLTARAQREDHLEALDAGVDDFLTKPLNQGDLAARMKTAQRILTWEHQLQDVNESLLRNAMVLATQAAEIDRMREEAEYLATHDMLTGVLNRHAWFTAATSTKPTAVAIFDIDFFKGVNDEHGHPAGDGVLIHVTQRLNDALVDQATLGRIGGEEFAALFHVAFTDAEEACSAALDAVGATPIPLPGGGSVTVTVSAGLSPWLGKGQLSREASLAQTYEAADKLLYSAKRAGRGRLVVETPKAA